jgi:hypothetical protein
VVVAAAAVAAAAAVPFTNETKVSREPGRFQRLLEPLSTWKAVEKEKGGSFSSEMERRRIVKSAKV